MGQEKNPQTGLNVQEMKFCEVYNKTGDALKAHTKAYPTNKASNKTKLGLAYALLHKKEIKKYLNILRSKDPDAQKDFFINGQKMAELFLKMYADTNNVAERSIALKSLENLAKSKYCDFFEKEQTNVNILSIQDASKIDTLLKAPSKVKKLENKKQPVIDCEIVKEENNQD